MEIANSSVKTALDRFLELHKDAKTDNEFMEVGFDIIQTLLNNIHMAQSHMFATLIGGILKTSDELYLKRPCDGNASNLPAHCNVIPFSVSETNDGELTDYMTQFSNISISPKNKGGTLTLPVLPYYLSNTACSELLTTSHEELSVSGTIKSRIESSDQCDASISELNTKRVVLGLNPISSYNVFDEDDSACPPYNHGHVMWHDKVNMDVEQCCARIGNQMFMIDHMESEFLDNYPSDTYIDENGIVHGRSCLRTIDSKLFEKGQIFCNDHAYGYEDIRKHPTVDTSCQSPDIDFM
jgi:hypothetical protein